MRKDDIRRANLRELIERDFRGIDGYLADAVGMPRSNLSRIMSGERPFTEKKAREMEQRLNLAPEALDFNPADVPATTPEERAFIADLSKLIASRQVSASIRAAILTLLDACPKKR